MADPEMTSGRLSYTTPRNWASRQVLQGCASELLLDQAHLEKKAAAGAVTFLFRVSLDMQWQRGLSVLAREELVHFERALKLLSRRRIPFTPQVSVAYATKLKGPITADMPARLVDELLTAAIIEARSCERMQLLAAEFGDVDPELADFYSDLVESEARHQMIYFEIAKASAREVDVEARWQSLITHEGMVLRALPWAPRLHSGVRSAATEAVECADDCSTDS